MEKKQDGRYYNYDLLKLLSCLCVILLHANWEYWGGVAYSPDCSADYLIGAGINIVTRFSVPCFAMITGAFLMNGELATEQFKNESGKWRAFYIKHTYKLFLPVVFALAIQVVIQLVQNIVNGNGVQSISFIKYVITGAFANLWYFYMLAVLYLVIPAVTLIKTALSKSYYHFLVIFLMIWSVASQATSEEHVFWSIGIVVPYVAYFMMGDILYDLITSRQWENRWKIGLFLVAIMVGTVGITLVVRARGFDYYLVKASVNFFSPTIVIYSICVFFLFGLIDIRRNVYLLSRHTFMIYLWHMLCMKYLKPIIDRFSLSMIGKTLVLFASTLLAAFIIGTCYEKVWLSLTKNFMPREKWEKLDVWKLFP